MRTLSLAIVVFLLLGCQSNKHDLRITKMEEFLKSQQKHFQFNGNVLVAEKGKVIYQNSFGYAQYETNRLLNDSSVFELASVSKQFTAAGILLLIEQNKLSLNDTLRKFFPELPYAGITLHHMLTHTSGLPDYMEVIDKKWDHKKIASNNDMINLLAQEKPVILFKPGARWEYSNTAFVILATIIEKVSGQTFKDFMGQNFFQPLGMTHTRVYNSRRAGETINNYAYGYVQSDSLNRFVLPDSVPSLEMVYFLDGITGDGIINSTTADLLKWDRSLVNHTVLNEASVNNMRTKHALVDTTSQGYYGYGVFTGSNQFGDYVSHSGGWPGYATNLARWVKDDLVIVVLSNNESASTAIQASLSNICFGKPVAIAYEHKAITLDSTKLKSFAGTYSLRGNKFTIAWRDKSLVWNEDKLLPESESKLFLKSRYDVQFELEKMTDGQSHFYRTLLGVKEELKKLD